MLKNNCVMVGLFAFEINYDFSKGNKFYRDITEPFLNLGYCMLTSLGFRATMSRSILDSKSTKEESFISFSFH